MADDFGLKIGLEGEKEFKKALSEINQSFKVLGSEMKVVQSQFDKNLICMEGQCTLKDSEGNELPLHAGESVLLPATTAEVNLWVDQHVKFLETYV